MTLSHCFAWLASPTISVLAAPGGTIGYTFCCASMRTWISAGPGRSMIACSAACGSTSLFKSQVLQAKTGGNLHKVNHPRIGGGKNALLMNRLCC